MKELEKQEIFEIEILEWLKNKRFLNKLIFGGGTMLRLCYGLPRYSVDLDFWLYRVGNIEVFFNELKNKLSNDYEITDSFNKFYTLLFEIKDAKFPRKLKIEIRKTSEKFNFQNTIAFSKYSNKQVLVRALTLEQAMQNKIKSFLDRKEIRDLFDVEFLLKKGINLNASKEQLEKIKKLINSFKKQDYAVTLGSLLESDIRKYYKDNNFIFLVGKIVELMATFKDA